MTRKDTLVVAASQHAWSMYQRYSAYLCQPGRSFRNVDRLAFYAHGAIKDRVPQILARRDEVHIDPQTVDKLSCSTDQVDRDVADLVERMLAYGEFVGNRNQVFLLSDYDDPKTLKLPHPVKNVKRDKNGKLTALTFGHGYTSSEALATGPRTTSELASSGG